MKEIFSNSSTECLLQSGNSRWFVSAMFDYKYNPDIEELIRIRKGRVLDSFQIHSRILHFLNELEKLNKKWDELALTLPTGVAFLIEEGYNSVYYRYKDRIILGDANLSEKRKLKNVYDSNILTKIQNLRGEIKDISWVISFYRGLFFISIEDRLEDVHVAIKNRKTHGRIYVGDYYYDIQVVRQGIDEEKWVIDWKPKRAFEIRISNELNQAFVDYGIIT